MAKTVGFLCALKPEWLDKTVDLVNEGIVPESIREILTNTISSELKSPDNIRKTREMLMKLWVHPFPDAKMNYIRCQALEAIKDGTESRNVLHWCMLLISFPVFSDVAGMVGKMLNMQESFTLAWLKGKLAEEWGARATLLRSVEKVMQTMRQMGIVFSENGIYQVNSSIVDNVTLKRIMVKTILSLKLRAYYEPSELAHVAQMFPFEYSIDSELVFGNQYFELGNFGGSPVIVG